jgi:hypothetical protein
MFPSGKTFRQHCANAALHQSSKMLSIGGFSKYFRFAKPDFGINGTFPKKPTEMGNEILVAYPCCQTAVVPSHRHAVNACVTYGDRLDSDRRKAKS